jgi:hypothetical protein
MASITQSCDVLVIGDEVESILTAVSAARAGAKTMLVRRSTGQLGGLSVRGGLSYMDITPELVTGLFMEFFQRAGMVRVTLNPDLAHQVLTQMLAEAQVEVFSGVEAQVTLNGEGFPQTAQLKSVSGTEPEMTAARPSVIMPQVVIDSTPDADVARALGVPFLTGLGGLLGQDQNFLGVSPVFRITGIPVGGFRAFEAELRKNPRLPLILEKALPYHPPELRAEYINRPTYAPPEYDYLDILNPVIGIDYHIWRYGTPSTYPTAPIAIDGANTARLSDKSLGFNGMVARADALGFPPDRIFEGLISLSQGGPIPGPLMDEMGLFEQYLREEGRFKKARIIPPKELYVRQTLTLLSRQNMTARQAIAGGVVPEKAIGTFSYWLDLRGAQLWKHFPNEELPKPVFNVGLDVGLPLSPQLQNFAFVSRAAGYSPIGQGTGRIVQHNSMLGEGMGIAAALAALTQTPLSSVADHAMPQIQAILAQRRDGQFRLSGAPTWSAEQMEASILLRHDAEAVAALRASATELSLL